MCRGVTMFVVGKTPDDHRDETMVLRGLMVVLTVTFNTGGTVFVPSKPTDEVTVS